MILKNLTAQIQEITVSDQYNNSLDYTIYVKAGGHIELDNQLTVRNLKSLVEKKVFTLLGGSIPTIPSEVINDTEREINKDIEDETDGDEGETSSEDETSGEDETVDELVAGEDKVVGEEKTSTDDGVITCSVCGKEFSSPRSLTMHMNKSHKE